MKIKTSELIGPSLDWAVGKAEGFFGGNPPPYFTDKYDNWYSPSINPAQAYPIIEKMGEAGLILMRATARKLGWRASLDFPNRFNFGPTLLIAAMRCYVASKLGDEVDIPEELT